MGEIGCKPEDLKHGLRWWEIRCIIRGYYRRHRDIWSATRWQTFHILASFSGTDQMKKNGWNNPTDLLPFPWEKEPVPPMSEDEVKQMQEEMKIFQDMMHNGQ